MTYAKWFEVCQIARRDRECFGALYREGVERAAALAAVEQTEHGCSVHAAITRIEEVFREHEWGSYVAPFNVKATLH